jgi:hypothetical protein
VGQVATVTDAVGRCWIGLPLPEWLDPAVLRFQWFHLDAAANPVGFVSTQRLRVPIVR